MIQEVNIGYFIMLVAILFIIYYIMTIREKFSQIEDKTTKDKTSRDCSQRAINFAFTDYIFGGLKFIR